MAKNNEEKISLIDFFNLVNQNILKAKEIYLLNNQHSAVNRVTNEMEMIHATLVQLFEMLTAEQKALLNKNYSSTFVKNCKEIFRRTDVTYQENFKKYCEENKKNNEETV